MKYLLSLLLMLSLGQGYGQVPVKELNKHQIRIAVLKQLPIAQTSPAFKTGEKFEGVRLTDLQGHKIDLKNTSGKIYVINFWFINCPPCKQEIPELNNLVKKYKDSENIVFLGIALDEKGALRKFLKTTPFNYNIVGNGQNLARKYGVEGYPTHVIVGKDGLIKFSTVGLGPNTIYWIDKTINAELAKR